MGEHVEVEGGVVVGYDGSEPARAALAWAIGEARHRGLVLHVVRAWTISSGLAQVEHPFGTVPSQAEIQQSLARLTHDDLGRLDTTDVTVEVHLVHGPTSKSLIDAAHGADHLVVGSRGVGGFSGLRLGSSAEQVVRHAACTVTVVRTPHR